MFSTIGKPKVIGSLIPQILGAIANLPKDLYLSLLAKNVIKIHRPKVPPTPPNEAKFIHEA